jgi:hypothetical protein
LTEQRAQSFEHLAPQRIFPLAAAATYTQRQHIQTIIFSFQAEQLMGNMHTLATKEATHRQRCPPDGFNRWVQLKTSGDGTSAAGLTFMSFAGSN